jgi:hypothetical protein
MNSGMTSTANSRTVCAITSIGRRRTVIHLALKVWKISSSSSDAIPMPAQ